LLDWVIRKACELDSEAADLSLVCLREYPRPEKLSSISMLPLQKLKEIAQNSKYQTLETCLKNQQWREADTETYRLMITTVGKEDGQWFDRTDLENFPCEDLRTLDQLWVKYSNGKWGFSVQKRIWQECGSPMKCNNDLEKLGDRVGWRKGGTWFVTAKLTYDLKKSLEGELPAPGWLVGGEDVDFVSFLLSRKDL